MQVLPNSLFKENLKDVNIYDYVTNTLISKNKVVLEQNVISFLIEGQKEVHFSDKSVEIDNEKILMMMQGNCLMTEQTLNRTQYQSILLFFSKQKLKDFIIKFNLPKEPSPDNNVSPYFVIEKDDYIRFFIQSLSASLHLDKTVLQKILTVKFEEIMLYLYHKYGAVFSNFLYSHINDAYELSFRTTIEANKYKTLGIEEIAFLCNMSISTFKRHFEEVYKQSPGKWFKSQKLNKAKELLQLGNLSPSELHRTFGYENLSNFSAAFKNEFGRSPKFLIE